MADLSCVPDQCVASDALGDELLPLRCDFCDSPLVDADAAPEVAVALAPGFRTQESDFLLTVKEAGTNMSQIRRAYEDWRRKQGQLANQLEAPDNHTRIRFDFRDIGTELLWCAVLRNDGDLIYVVSLRDDSAIDSELKSGTEHLAEWDGQTFDAITRLPVLDSLIAMSPDQ